MNINYKTYALQYAKSGLRVFPLNVNNKTPNGKLVKKGCLEATTDQATISKWWDAAPESNIGIATGGDLVVIDFDRHGNDNTAFDYLEKWEESHGNLPRTLTATTGNGEHWYYFTDSEAKNFQGGSHSIDVRGYHGYVVAPPSLHPSGKVYEWKNRAPIAHVDKNVIDFIESLKSKEQPTTTAIGRHAGYKLPPVIGDGNRNAELFKFASSLQGKGYDDTAIEAQVLKAAAENCNPPYPKDEALKIVHTVVKRYKKGTPHAIQSYDGNEILPDMEFVVTKNSKQFIGSFTNLSAILKCDPAFENRFYYDARACRIKLRLPLPWDNGKGERILRDVDYSYLMRYLEQYKEPGTGEDMSIRATDKNVIAAISMEANDNTTDPLVEWLDSLEWDGRGRMDFVFSNFLGAENDEYTREVARLMFMGAVARAYTPGVKFDFVPVLVGSQGIGKSEFVKKMCPRNEWYLDNLTTMEGDSAIEKIEGKWIVEIAELANLRHDKIENVKAFITQTQDVYRPKYHRNAEDRQRGCIFIGTTNSETFLADQTGNRRWLPIKCGVNAPTLSLFKGGETEHYFEQCWAECVWAFKAGVDTSLVIRGELIPTVEEKRSSYCESDWREGVIQEFLRKKVATYVAEQLGKGEKLSLCAPELRTCAAEIEKCCFDDNVKPKHTFREIKDIVQRQGEWEYQPGKNRCKTNWGRHDEFSWGIQRYFLPKFFVDADGNRLDENGKRLDELQD